MKYRLLVIASMLLAFVAVPSVSAAPKNNTKDPLGVDISYPQCNSKVPNNHAFGIVGVNGGLATIPNPCLDQQLTWASKAVEGTTQEAIQLYVNTANPGGLETASWPQDNFDPSGNFIINPHGYCSGSDSLACAWQYGWNRANEDVQEWFIPAATKSGIDANPAKYIWWLDVETENTWKTGKTQFDYQSNVAVLEGMSAYLKLNSIRIGLYSTAYQWGEIVSNSVTNDSILNRLPNWRPGGASLATAKQACKADPLTLGGKVVLTQYISRGIDYNFSCVE